MREVEAQKELVDAVRGAGGAANKLSNRFLIGVSDLLLKLPDYPAVLIEAKMNDVGPKMASVLVEPTPIQLRFLRDYRSAGMLTGVVSFVVRGREFGVVFLPLDRFDSGSEVRVLTGAHAWCPMGGDSRKSLLLNNLIGYLKEETNGRHGTGAPRTNA